MSAHVAQVIANVIYLSAGMAPTRHLVDPDKSNRALGFPALITGLCQSYGVPVTPSLRNYVPVAPTIRFQNSFFSNIFMKDSVIWREV